MNGERRRFVLGTVLSIQNSSFTYPACQHCLSRLTRRSSFSSFQCQRCGSSCDEASHRYRLCLKIAEDRALHIVTVFGSCLDSIFGTGASSLLRLMQAGSEQLPGSGEGDRAAALLFQAAEDCLIGRSFIFATKVPENCKIGVSDVGSHLTACQIIPVANDPAGSTILDRYYCLAGFILSNSSCHSRADSDATDRTLQDLSDSKSSASFYQCGKRSPDFWQHSFDQSGKRSPDFWQHSFDQSGKRSPDYWQLSLGLISSPTVSTSQSTPSSPCQKRPNEAKEQSLEKKCKLQESEISAQKPEASKSIFAATDHPSAPLISPLKVNKSPSSSPKPCNDTYGFRPQRCSSDFPSLASPSPLPCWQPDYLRSVCDSGSHGSQDHSARLERFPSPNIQTAESHQAEDGIWDEFPFSESLSEFMVRVENAEETRSHSSFKRNKSSSSNKKDDACKRSFTNMSECIKPPDLSTMKKTLIETAQRIVLKEGSDPNSSLVDVSIIVQDGILPSEEQGSESGILQGLSKNGYISIDCASEANTSKSQCGLNLHKKLIAPYVKTEVEEDLQNAPFHFSSPEDPFQLGSESGDLRGHSRSSCAHDYNMVENFQSFQRETCLHKKGNVLYVTGEYEDLQNIPADISSEEPFLLGSVSGDLQECSLVHDFIMVNNSQNAKCQTYLHKEEENVLNVTEKDEDLQDISSEEPFQQGSYVDPQGLSNCGFIHEHKSIDCSSVDKNSHREMILKKEFAPYETGEEDLNIQISTNIRKPETLLPAKNVQNDKIIGKDDGQCRSASGIWDELPYSESLSEFIGRLENAQETRFDLGFRETEFGLCSRKSNVHLKGSSFSGISEIQPYQKVKNETETQKGGTEITTQGWDAEQNASTSAASNIVRYDGCTFENPQGPFPSSLVHSVMSVNSFDAKATKINTTNIVEEDLKASDHIRYLTKTINERLESSTFEGTKILINCSTTLDHFPFSEHSSKQISRVNNGEETQFKFHLKDPKFSSKKKEASKRHGYRRSDYNKTPKAFLAWSCQNSPTNITLQNLDNSGYPEITVLENSCRIGHTSFSKETIDCSPSKNLWGWSKDSDNLSVDLANVPTIQNPSGDSQTSLTNNKTAIAGIKGSMHNYCVSKKIHLNTLPVSEGIASHIIEAGNVDSEDILEENSLNVRSDDPKSISRIYNASEDLFEVDMEELFDENQQSKASDRRHGSEFLRDKSLVDCLVDSPCSNVIVSRTFSSVHAGVLQDYRKAFVDDCLEVNQRLKSNRSLKRCHGLESFNATHIEKFPHSNAIGSRRMSKVHTRFVQNQMKTSVDDSVEQILKENQKLKSNRSLKSHHGMEGFKATQLDCFAHTDVVVSHKYSPIHTSQIKSSGDNSVEQILGEDQRLKSKRCQEVEVFKEECPHTITVPRRYSTSYLQKHIKFSIDDSADLILEADQQPNSKRSLKRCHGEAVFKATHLENCPHTNTVPRRYSTSYLQNQIQFSVEDSLQLILEEDQQPKSKRSHGMEVFKATYLQKSPHSDAILPRRRSNMDALYLHENAAALHMQNLFPHSQSTPVLQHLTKSGVRHSLTGFLMRKIRRSVDLSGSALFSRFLEKFPACSPISAPFLGPELSDGKILQQKKTLVYKSTKKDKENREVQINSSGLRNNTECVAWTLDKVRLSRHGTKQSKEDSINDSSNVSPASQASVSKGLAAFWSPELFHEKSTMMDQAASVQKRLFSL